MTHDDPKIKMLRFAKHLVPNSIKTCWFQIWSLLL